MVLGAQPVCPIEAMKAGQSLTFGVVFTPNVSGSLYRKSRNPLQRFESTAERRAVRKREHRRAVDADSHHLEFWQRQHRIESIPIGHVERDWFAGHDLIGYHHQRRVLARWNFASGHPRLLANRSPLP